MLDVNRVFSSEELALAGEALNQAAEPVSA
jgi:hypothetical protein